MTGLEALIKQKDSLTVEGNIFEHTNEYKIIEKELKQAKSVYQKIDGIIASFYNDEMSSETAINIIDELLKDVDWRNKDEVK